MSVSCRCASIQRASARPSHPRAQRDIFRAFLDFLALPISAEKVPVNDKETRESLPTPLYRKMLT